MKPDKPWHPIAEPLRPEFLAWREAEQGIEVLAYNYALWQTADPVWSQFYIERAPSLSAVSGAI